MNVYKATPVEDVLVDTALELHSYQPRAVWSNIIACSESQQKH